MKNISSMMITGLLFSAFRAPDFGDGYSAREDFADEEDDLSLDEMDALLSAIFGGAALPVEHLTETKVDEALARLKQHLLSGEWEGHFERITSEADADREIAEDIEDMGSREAVAEAVIDEERRFG